MNGIMLGGAAQGLQGALNYGLQQRRLDLDEERQAREEQTAQLQRQALQGALDEKKAERTLSDVAADAAPKLGTQVPDVDAASQSGNLNLDSEQPLPTKRYTYADMQKEILGRTAGLGIGAKAMDAANAIASRHISNALRNSLLSGDLNQAAGVLSDLVPDGYKYSVVPSSTMDAQANPEALTMLRQKDGQPPEVIRNFKDRNEAMLQLQMAAQPEKAADYMTKLNGMDQKYYGALLNTVLRNQATNRRTDIAEQDADTRALGTIARVAGAPSTAAGTRGTGTRGAAGGGEIQLGGSFKTQGDVDKYLDQNGFSLQNGMPDLDRVIPPRSGQKQDLVPMTARNEISRRMFDLAKNNPQIDNAPALQDAATRWLNAERDGTANQFPVSFDANSGQWFRSVPTGDAKASFKTGQPVSDQGYADSVLAQTKTDKGSGYAEELAGMRNTYRASGITGQNPQDVLDARIRDGAVQQYNQSRMPYLKTNIEMQQRVLASPNALRTYAATHFGGDVGAAKRALSTSASNDLAELQARAKQSEEFAQRYPGGNAMPVKPQSGMGGMTTASGEPEPTAEELAAAQRPALLGDVSPNPLGFKPRATLR